VHWSQDLDVIDGVHSEPGGDFLCDELQDAFEHRLGLFPLDEVEILAWASGVYFGEFSPVDPVGVRYDQASHCLAEDFLEPDDRNSA